jgi:DNA-binding NtrC family response regulator
MFGHARGAFTGAVRDRVGRFELASSGTLFLDEVGDLPVELQVKLLRVLQDGTFERLGESHTRTSRARVIAATHVDLGRAVREGRFREDLYYRLRVVPIEVPPLRERREDIEPLSHAILARVGARQGRALRFSPDALRKLLQYDWPGNVRELENALEYAVAVCRRQTVLPEDLPRPEALHRAKAPGAESSAESGVPRESIRKGGTRRGPGSARLAPSEEVLRRTLEECRWHRRETARKFGVSRTTLWRWMREGGIA